MRSSVVGMAVSWAGASAAAILPSPPALAALALLGAAFFTLLFATHVAVFAGRVVRAAARTKPQHAPETVSDMPRPNRRELLELALRASGAAVLMAVLARPTFASFRTGQGCEDNNGVHALPGDALSGFHCKRPDAVKAAGQTAENACKDVCRSLGGCVSSVCGSIGWTAGKVQCEQQDDARNECKGMKGWECWYSDVSCLCQCGRT
jgi:hypothetical protein